jgi:hypothetical protein
MFVLMIDGTPVAVTDADQAEAEALFASEGFKEDLKSFTSGGQPVWNGTTAFVVRPATEDELEMFEDALADDEEFEDEELDDADLAAGEDDEDFDDEDEDGGYSVMFLVAVDQLSDEA